jgi:hypothetical protein
MVYILASGNGPALREFGGRVMRLVQSQRRGAVIVALTALLVMASGSLAQAALPPLADVPVPVVTGTKAVGNTLTATVTGTSTPEADSLTVVWLRDDAQVGTGTTYELTAADQGKSLVARTVAQKLDYEDTSADAEPYGPINPGTLTFTPSVSGTFAQGFTLTANGAPADATVTYQWRRNGYMISGATASTYKLTSSDVGKKVTVSVKAARSGYTTATKTTTASANVKRIFTKSYVPKITGTAKVGVTLKASAGTWSPAATFSYQWLRDGVAISGANKYAYKTTRYDEGKAISVKVTGTKSGYLSVSKTSLPTTLVGKGTVTAPTPKITGTQKVGAWLQVSIGSVYPSTVTKTFQWYRSGYAIAGATSYKYELKNVDAGKKISVKVTYSALGYTDRTVTSASTATIAYRTPGMSAAGYYRVTSTVGSGNVRPGTYYLAGAKEDCVWARETNTNPSDGEITWGSGGVRWIVTIESTDKYFFTSGCGNWYLYDGTASLASSSPGDGIFQINVHLRPGEYRVSGTEYQCEIFFMDDATLEEGSVYDQLALEAGDTFAIFEDDPWIATFNCGAITRVGDVPVPG